MAVRRFGSATQDALPTVFCGLEDSCAHTYILALVLLLMLLPTVAIFIRVIVTDSAPICMVWIRRLD